MIKMYLAEVLNKLPVMQHFLFGSILPYDGPPPPVSVVEHSHDANCSHPNGSHGTAGVVDREMGWRDCCGIPVPSAFAAAQAEKDKKPGIRLAGPGIRPVPFD